ncbi:MAG TPA: glycosyltransferase family 4 protein [Pyrinomonadaceae bacterium]|jgi:glycosyltransferase involved in cell wall biosynthesis
MSHARHAPRVCFVTPGYPPATGGISRSAGRVVKYLAGDFDVHVFTFVKGRSAGVSISSAREDGVQVHRLSIPSGASEIIIAHSIRQAIHSIDKQAPFDIFHCFFLPLAYPCLDIADKGSRPILASLRGADGTLWLENDWQRNILSSILKRVAWVTSVNTEMLDRMSALGLVRERSSVIRNAIESKALPVWRANEDNRGVVGTVGEFRAAKNIPLLVEAYARIDGAQRRKLVLVGDFSEEDERARSVELISRYNLAAEAQLTGMLNDDEIEERLLSMRVFVLCSRREGFPNALLEAAAVRVPLVATAVGGLKDILTNGENALLVPPDEPDSLASAIESVLRDENLALRLSRGAWRLARSLDPKHEKKAWHDLYKQMLLPA